MAVLVTAIRAFLSMARRVGVDGPRIGIECAKLGLFESS
jgi:hypothetical protein